MARRRAPGGVDNHGDPLIDFWLAVFEEALVRRDGYAAVIGSLHRAGFSADEIATALLALDHSHDEAYGYLLRRLDGRL